MRIPRVGVLLVGALASATGVGQAQLVRPRAAVVPVVESDRVHAGTDVRAALRVSLPEGLHVQSNAPRDPSLIPTILTIEPPAGITVDEIVYPPSTDLKQLGQDQPLAVFEREFPIGARLTLPPGLPAGDLSIPLHLRYQACDATVCYPPATADAQWSLQVVAASVPPGTARHPEVFDHIAFRGDHARVPSPATPVATGTAPARVGSDNGMAQLDHFTVLDTKGGYLGRVDFLRFIHNAESGTKERGLFEGRGPLAIVLIVFLGGLALNLTPCVLPMIPINLAIIGAGTRAGSRGRGFLLGSAYGAAMALVYGVLGLVVILTAGTFGTINASPWFNIGIAVLFVVLGLAMFDVILIDFSRFASGFRAGDDRRGTLLLAFSMGGIAALLAGACVAPVVIQVVLFSSNLYAMGTRVALALPFCLGIGMAVPWPIAGAGLAALPKPGAWMVRVKQVLGVVILGTAVYYGDLAFELLSNRWVDRTAVTSSVDEKIKEGWHSSLAAGLAAAEREHKPVLIDMWATWCKNCLTMDKTTLENADVKAALSEYVKIKFQAEEPDRPPAKDVMQRFEAVGLPTYVILRPGAATPRRDIERPPSERR
jgi:thiol:disulfide interchange protein DsbD